MKPTEDTPEAEKPTDEPTDETPKEDIPEQAQDSKNEDDKARSADPTAKKTEEVDVKSSWCGCF